jgi:hypothetical protein
MRRIVGVTVALALTGLAGLAGCKSIDRDEAPLRMVTEPARPPRTPAGELARDFVQTRDRFVAATEATLVELDAKIATLKADLAARAGEAQTAATRATQDAVASLEAQRSTPTTTSRRSCAAEAWRARPPCAGARRAPHRHGAAARPGPAVRAVGPSMPPPGSLAPGGAPRQVDLVDRTVAPVGTDRFGVTHLEEDAKWVRGAAQEHGDHS